jgi:hypothetical protein
MFFSISKQLQENFPCHYTAGQFVINTDVGWKQELVGNFTVVYKGYADNFDLSSNLELVIAQPQPVASGNFCALVYLNDCITIHSSRDRSFPIFITDDCVNNLIPGEKIAWADSLVTINKDMSVTEEKFDAIGDIDISPISKQQVQHEIIELLDKKTKAFLSHNTLPINAFLSGGVDSLLVYSFLQKHTKNYTMINHAHVDYDYFWMKNSGDIVKFWAYKQIHHWIAPNILTSGAPGDEMTLRAPFTAGMYLMHHNVDIFELLERPAYMQKSYFLLDKNKKLFNSMHRAEIDKSALFRQMCNINLNDWQHWHLGNTLTWTPLRDLEIFKLMLRLPLADVIDQFLDSKFSLDIIEYNCPGLSHAVSDQKNTGNALKNLDKFKF